MLALHRFLSVSLEVLKRLDNVHQNQSAVQAALDKAETLAAEDPLRAAIISASRDLQQKVYVELTAIAELLQSA